MSLSSYVINNMNIVKLLKYLKNANNSIALLENALSHSIRIRPVIKSRTIELVENIMELRDILEKMYKDKEDLAQKLKELKVLVIDLLDSDFDNNFVKNMRLKLNDYIDPTLLVAYAEIKLGNMGPDILLEALMAKNLANKANKMRNMIDSIDPNIIDRTTLDVYHIRQHEEMIKKYIAQSSAILHGLDEYTHNLSINKAGQIIKRRIRNTKRRNINSRRRNKRNNR